MKTTNKVIKGLLITSLLIGITFTAQAKKKHKKNKLYLGPIVEVCKTKKDGTEVCKDKKLHGQKAIEFIYQELLMYDATIAANADAISNLRMTTGKLGLEIEFLTATVSDNTGNIAINAANIKNMVFDISNLRTENKEQVMDLIAMGSDLSGLGGKIETQYVVDQVQMADLQEKIDDNHAQLLAMLADLNKVLTVQKTELGNSIDKEISALKVAADAQVDLLQKSIIDLRADIDASELATATHITYANAQVNMILADIMTLNIDIGKLEDLADNMADSITDNEGLISTLNADIVANDADIASLMKMVAAMDSRFAPLEAFHQAYALTITETTRVDIPNNDFIRNFLASYPDLSPDTYLGISGRNNNSGQIVGHCIADAERFLDWLNAGESKYNAEIDPTGSYSYKTGSSWLPVKKLIHFNRGYFWLQPFQSSGNVPNMGVLSTTSLPQQEIYVEGYAKGNTITYQLGNSTQEACGFTP